MRGSRLALCDWTIVFRFDDGSIATLLAPAGPPELCAGVDGAPVRRDATLRGRIASALGSLGGAQRPVMDTL